MPLLAAQGSTAPEPVQRLQSDLCGLFPHLRPPLLCGEALEISSATSAAVETGAADDSCTHCRERMLPCWNTNQCLTCRHTQPASPKARSMRRVPQSPAALPQRASLRQAASPPPQHRQQTLRRMSSCRIGRPGSAGASGQQIAVCSMETRWSQVLLPASMVYHSVIPCSVCNVSCTSQETLHAHATGKKHIRRVGCHPHLWAARLQWPIFCQHCASK
jgi:Zinc-finger of C2H2 type